MSHVLGVWDRDAFGSVELMALASCALSAACFAVCCACAFAQQSNAFVVSTHGAVLGVSFASIEGWHGAAEREARGALLRAQVLVLALFVEFFVIGANPNATLNFVNSLLVMTHMAWFVVWIGAQSARAEHERRRAAHAAPEPEPAPTDDDLSDARQLEARAWARWRCVCGVDLDAVLKHVALLGPSLVDGLLAPNVGPVALRPLETTAPTLLGALAFARALPYMHFSTRHHDYVPSTLVVLAVLIGFGVYTAVAQWYVQTAYLWSLVALVASHFSFSFVGGNGAAPADARPRAKAQ